MAAMQARAFAATGFGVLQMDLFGCGDSSGEFGDARWDIWMQDVAIAQDWLENRADTSVNLWGLRLGALLALDYARISTRTIEHIVMWQPVINGELFVNQFLRLRVANEMLAGAEMRREAAGTTALRKCLLNGEPVEVAGYELAPALVAAMDGLKAPQLAVLKSTIHWFEIVAEPGRSMPPAGVKVVEEWRRRAIEADVRLISCAQFWATQEITECSELVSATTGIFSTAA
jgi:exosortase A-associated hydrolase 2